MRMDLVLPQVARPAKPRFAGHDDPRLVLQQELERLQVEEAQAFGADDTFALKQKIAGLQQILRGNDAQLMAAAVRELRDNSSAQQLADLEQVRRHIAHLQNEEAIASDPSAKFGIREKIKKLQAQLPESERPKPVPPQPRRQSAANSPPSFPGSQTSARPQPNPQDTRTSSGMDPLAEARWREKRAFLQHQLSMNADAGTEYGIDASLDEVAQSLGEKERLERKTEDIWADRLQQAQRKLLTETSAAVKFQLSEQIREFEARSRGETPNQGSVTDILGRKLTFLQEELKQAKQAGNEDVIKECEHLIPETQGKLKQFGG